MRSASTFVISGSDLAPLVSEIEMFHTFMTASGSIGQLSLLQCPSREGHRAVPGISWPHGSVIACSRSHEQAFLGQLLHSMQQDILDFLTGSLVSE